MQRRTKTRKECEGNVKRNTYYQPLDMHVIKSLNIEKLGYIFQICLLLTPLHLHVREQQRLDKNVEADVKRNIYLYLHDIHVKKTENIEEFGYIYQI